MSDQTKRGLDGLACPVPRERHARVQLGHGGGGRMTRALVDRFARTFDNPLLRPLHDGAVFDVERGRLAFTTDGYVVRPIFFPGGDIGSLSVHGTVNDLAMCGARPIALSAAFILEEGFPMDDLDRVTRSMQTAAAAAGVPIATGDTKVVDRGKGDGIYIATTGVGAVRDGVDVAPTRARPGDVVLLSGEIAVHGIAVISVREGLEFETAIESDSAALHGLVSRVLDAAGAHVHVLRDPTRGGVASATNEIADAARVGIRLDERAIPIREDVRGACEILGFDPLYVANEGRFIAFVAAADADRALAILAAHPVSGAAMVIGRVTPKPAGIVTMKSRIGATRIVDRLSGEQLPRIC